MQLPNDLRLTMMSWLVVPVVAIWAVSVFWVQLVMNKGDLEFKPRSDGAEKAAAFTETAREVAKGKTFEWTGTGLVTLWFDDAWKTQYSATMELMDRHDFRGTLAVPTQLVGYKAYMNWYQVRKMAFEGWEMTAHSRIHVCDWKGRSAEEIKSEVVGSQEDLLALGYPVNNYVAPCGVLAPVVEQVKTVYSSARGVEVGVNPLPVVNRYNLKAVTMGVDTTVDEVEKWLIQAKAEKGWLILVFHQISPKEALQQVNQNEEPYSVTEAQFAAILDKVKEAGLPVVVPEEALEIKN